MNMYIYVFIYYYSYMPCIGGVDKVWRVLRLLPKSEIVELIETQNTVEVCIMMDFRVYGMLTL